MRPLLAFALLTAGLGHSAAAADPVRVTIITRYAQTLADGLGEFERKYGGDLLNVRLVDASSPCAEWLNSHVIYIHDISWTQSLTDCRERMRSREKRGGLLGAQVPAWIENYWGLAPSSVVAPLSRYLQFGGKENAAGFFAALYRAAGGTRKVDVPAPRPVAEAAIYHPFAPAAFVSLQEYFTWYKASGRVPPGAPLVGIAFFQTNYVNGDVAHVDALIAALEKRGLGVVAAYGWPLRRAEPFFIQDGRPVIHLAFCLNLISPSLDNGAFLEQYRLHAINLLTTTESDSEWLASRRGLPLARVALQAGTPERAGATEPILIATTARSSDGKSSRLVPVAERVEMAAARAARWVSLRTKPNSEKRVALLYFNNPPGKGTLGASYLNLMPSLSNILAFLHKEGYRTDARPPSEEQLKRLLLLGGRNVGSYAPGEVEALVRDGHVTLLPLAQYESWYRQLPASFRAATEKAWGPPSQSQQMTLRVDGKVFFIIPGVRIGNIFLGPQPLRGDLARSAALTHDPNAAVPHSYLACYLWYRHQFQADALVHLGRHGTLEWLPGKEIAQAAADSGEVLVGDLPHAYFYVVDGGGEYLQAKRRASAVMISHLTPLLAAAGVPPEWQRLKDAVDNHQRVAGGDHDSLAAQYEAEIIAETVRLRLDRQLEIDLSKLPAATVIERVEQLLHDVEAQPVPLGLHAIGQRPASDVLVSALEQFLQGGFTGDNAVAVRPFLRPWAEAMVARRELPDAGRLPVKLRDEAVRWLQHLEESPSQELRSLADVLNGLHLATGVSGDPLRTPDALPTGRNMHDQDPRLFPTRAAWEVGRRMAEGLLDERRRRDGRYPEKMALVLWYGEASRQQGISEAQALALLGVEPVWNGRGQVDDVRLIPAAKLGRPRVDVVLTVSGLYRDGMPEKMRLLDKATRLAGAAPDDNAVKRNSEQVIERLMGEGVDAATARKAAAARIFGPAPGSFGVGIAGMMESSRDGGDGGRVADAYLGSMNHAYSADLWGEQVKGNLKAQLANNRAVIHARSTNLYGVLDNDETYQFAGGLNAATTAAAGQAPEFLVSNARRAGQERFESMKGFLAREMNGRIWNPTWIRAMQDSGYGGAQQISKEIEHLYGFRSTAPESVDEQVWQQAYDVYIADKHKLGVNRLFAEQNPYAGQMLAARLLEVDRQGVYHFSAEDRKQLLAAYMESVARHGVSCYANACDNRRLTAHIRREALAAGVSTEAFSAWQQRMSQATAPRPVTAGALKAPSAVRPVRSSAAALFDFVRTIPPSLVTLHERHSKWAFLLWFSSLGGGLLLAILRHRAPGWTCPSIHAEGPE